MEIEAGTGQPTIMTRLAGEDLVIVREITLPGELAEDGLEHIVAAIQTSSREHGQPSLLGRSLTWRADDAEPWTISSTGS